MQTTIVTTEFLLTKINKEYKFSLIKISVEFWMLVQKAINTLKINILKCDTEYLKSDIFLKQISSEMVKQWHANQANKRPWKASKHSLFRILKFITTEKPNNILFGVTNTGGSTKYPHKQKFLNNRKNVKIFLEKVLEKDLILYDATCWKYWSYTGEINNFFKKIKRKNIVIVGPNHLKDLNKRINIKNFTYIEIPDRNASLYTVEIKNEIVKHNKSTNAYTIYIIQGGSPAMDFMTMAHNEVNNCCMLDVGRSIDVYYYYDTKIKKDKAAWYWGRWLEKKPPKWLLKK